MLNYQFGLDTLCFTYLTLLLEIRNSAGVENECSITSSLAIRIRDRNCLLTLASVNDILHIHNLALNLRFEV